LKTKISVLATLLFILAGSIFLRLYKIGDKPAWYDETVSISHAEKPSSFYLSSTQVNYKPVYFFLLNLWLTLFGEDVFSLRFFSLLWGILNIILIFKLVRLLFDEETGLLSAFFLGISVFHIFQCQQIRQFSFIALLATASIYYLAKFYKTGRTFNISILSSINILLINTYPTGFFVVLAEGIFVAIYLRGIMIRKWIFSCIPLVLFAVRWFFITDKAHMKELVWWIRKPGMGSILETFNTLCWGGPRYGLDDFMIFLPRPWLVLVLSLIYLILIALSYSNAKAALKKDGNRGISLLFSWLMVPVLASYFISRVCNFSIYAIKHLIIVLPAFCTLVASGFLRFNTKTKAVIIFSISVMNLAPLSVMYNNYFPSDWKTSTEYVSRSIQEGDAVVISSLSEVITFMYYFDKKKHSLRDIDIYGRITKSSYKNNIFLGPNNTLIIGIKQAGFDDKHISSKNDFEDKVINNPLLNDKRSIWVMLSRWADSDVKAYMVSYFDSHLMRESAKEFQGVAVYHYENHR